MRIAWFSPLSERTGVAKYSVSAASALAEHARVDIWTTRRDDDLAVELPIREIGELDADPAALDGYDAVVYNLGNNPEMHADIFRVYRGHPGVVILHDRVMSHFMRVYFTVDNRDPALFADLLQYYYGPAEAAKATRHALGIAVAGSVDDVPFVEPCLFNAHGVVVHSDDALALVDRYPGVMPVVALDLPFNVYDEATRLKGRGQLGIPEDSVLIVTHGHLGENKRIEALLRAFSLLGADTLARSFLVVAGGAHPGYMRLLQDTAARLGVTDRVRFTGRIDDTDMLSYLRCSDIFANLRYPSTESASGSLVEQLHFGRPVIVSDISFYASLPDDVVLKTPPQDDGTVIAQVLGRLVDDETLRDEYAARVRLYAHERFDRGRYAARLVEFLGVVGERREELLDLDRSTQELMTVPVAQVHDTAVRLAHRFPEGPPPSATPASRGSSTRSASR